MFCDFTTCVSLMRQTFLAEINKVFFHPNFFSFGKRWRLGWRDLIAWKGLIKFASTIPEVTQEFSHIILISKNDLQYSDDCVTQSLLIMSSVTPFIVCTYACSTGNVPYILFILVGGDNEQRQMLSEELRLGRGKAKFILQKRELNYNTLFLNNSR